MLFLKAPPTSPCTPSPYQIAQICVTVVVCYIQYMCNLLFREWVGGWVASYSRCDDSVHVNGMYRSVLAVHGFHHRSCDPYECHSTAVNGLMFRSGFQVVGFFFEAFGACESVQGIRWPINRVFLPFMVHGLMIVEGHQTGPLCGFVWLI